MSHIYGFIYGAIKGKGAVTALPVHKISHFPLALHWKKNWDCQTNKWWQTLSSSIWVRGDPGKGQQDFPEDGEAWNEQEQQEKGTQRHHHHEMKWREGILPKGSSTGGRQSFHAQIHAGRIPSCRSSSPHHICSYSVSWMLLFLLINILNINIFRILILFRILIFIILILFRILIF